jgi:hypothetical protein
MKKLFILAVFALLSPGLAAQTFRFESLQGLELRNVSAEVVKYRGRTAVRVVERPSEGDSIAILSATDFGDGVIEAEIAGTPAAGAGEGARGFVGIAFRVQSDPSRYEAFYLRPTNGRANDQVRRNHSTQYISHPDFPWHRLRKEFPGLYESYVDLVPGEWTKVKIVVSGSEAKLYVHGAEQPCLIVNDLQHRTSRGRIALWVGQGTEAHFASLKITAPRASPTR